MRTAVEIGAGTGKATRLFTAAGVRVTALGPDPAMLALLESNVGGDVEPRLCTFEDADLSGRVDLVYAAAALHWTDPDSRWSRIAARLPPGGVVSSFGGPRHIADQRLREQVRRVREPYITDDDLPSPDGTSAYLILPAEDRQEVLSQIRSVLSERLGLIADLTLHLARRSEVALTSPWSSGSRVGSIDISLARPAQGVAGVSSGHSMAPDVTAPATS